MKRKSEFSIFIRGVPLARDKGAFKACMWCQSDRGDVAEAPKNKHPAHGGRLVCSHCARQLAWLSPAQVRLADAVADRVQP